MKSYASYAPVVLLSLVISVGAFGCASTSDDVETSIHAANESPEKVEASLSRSSKSAVTGDEWLVAGNLKRVDTEAYEEAFSDRIKWQKYRATNPIGDVETLTQALAFIESQVPYLGQARWRLQLFIDPNVDTADERGWYIDIYRFNPHKEKYEGSVEVAPNLHWRMHYINLQGAPMVYAESTETVSDKVAEDVDCFGVSCMTTGDVIKGTRLADGSWAATEIDRKDRASVEVPVIPPSNGRLSSRVAWATDDGFLTATQIGYWPISIEEEGSSGSFESPIATLVIDLDYKEPGQDRGIICDFDMRDDSVRDYCVEASVGASNEVSYRQYLACYRGDASSGSCL